MKISFLAGQKFFIDHAVIFQSEQELHMKSGNNKCPGTKAVCPKNLFHTTLDPAHKKLQDRIQK